MVGDSFGVRMGGCWRRAGAGTSLIERHTDVNTRSKVVVNNINTLEGVADGGQVGALSRSVGVGHGVVHIRVGLDSHDACNVRCEHEVVIVKRYGGHVKGEGPTKDGNGRTHRRAVKY